MYSLAPWRKSTVKCWLIFTSKPEILPGKTARIRSQLQLYNGKQLFTKPRVCSSSKCMRKVIGGNYNSCVTVKLFFIKSKSATLTAERWENEHLARHFLGERNSYTAVRNSGDSWLEVLHHPACDCCETLC